MENWLNLMTPPEDVQNRREAAEQEAAHAVVAQAFGSNVPIAAIGDDHSGFCRCRRPGLTDLQRVAVMMTPKVWINSFRSLQFPRGATGTEQDVRDDAATSADLEEARRRASAIMRENRPRGDGQFVRRAFRPAGGRPVTRGSRDQVSPAPPAAQSRARRARRGTNTTAPAATPSTYER